MGLTINISKIKIFIFICSALLALKGLSRNKSAPHQIHQILLFSDTSILSKTLIKYKDTILYSYFIPKDLSLNADKIKIEDYKKLIYSDNEPLLTRLLGVLVIMYDDKSGIHSFDLNSISKLLIQSLKNNSTGYYSDWGFLGKLSGPSFGGTKRLQKQELGPAGSIFKLVGPSIIPELAKLLSDNTPVNYSLNKDAYYASKDFYTEQHLLWKSLRVKDFAALYISEIKNYNMKFDADTSKRDIEIDNMLKYLKLN